MSSQTRLGPFNDPEETGDDLIDSFQLPVRFADSRTEHFRRITDIRRGIRNAIHVQSWCREKELGRGGFGTVYLESEKNGLVRAVKEVPKYTGRTKTMDYLREILAMAHFSKEEAFFVRLEGWYQSHEHIYIAMEYMPNGDLSDCVEGPVTEKEVRIITFQLLEALQFMHQKKFTHRDLKPSNVFVVSKAPNWWVKLGDFGVSKRVRHDSTSMHTSIETDYTAPEITGHVAMEDEASCYTSAVDMWSLGCLVFWLLTWELPLTRRELLSYCMERIPFPTRRMNECESSAEAIDFVSKLLKPQPTSRITASDGLKDNWPMDLQMEDITEQIPNDPDITTAEAGFSLSALDLPPTSDSSQLDQMRNLNISDISEKPKSVDADRTTTDEHFQEILNMYRNVAMRSKSSSHPPPIMWQKSPAEAAAPVKIAQRDEDQAASTQRDQQSTDHKDQATSSQIKRQGTGQDIQSAKGRSESGKARLDIDMQWKRFQERSVEISDPVERATPGPSGDGQDPPFNAAQTKQYSKDSELPDYWSSAFEHSKVPKQKDEMGMTSMGNDKNFEENWDLARIDEQIERGQKLLDSAEIYPDVKRLIIENATKLLENQSQNAQEQMSIALIENDMKYAQELIDIQARLSSGLKELQYRQQELETSRQPNSVSTEQFEKTRIELAAIAQTTSSDNFPSPNLSESEMVQLSVTIIAGTIDSAYRTLAPRLYAVLAVDGKDIKYTSTLEPTFDPSWKETLDVIVKPDSVVRLGMRTGFPKLNENTQTSYGSYAFKLNELVEDTNNFDVTYSNELYADGYTLDTGGRILFRLSGGRQQNSSSVAQETSHVNSELMPAGIMQEQRSQTTLEDPPAYSPLDPCLTSNGILAGSLMGSSATAPMCSVQ